MKAFQRLDHLLCEVPNIEVAFELFTNKLGFPAAWPIGRFWPGKQTCGVALGGINLEFIQPDQNPPPLASIRRIAFEPTDRVQERFDHEGIPAETSEKWETSPTLLKLRGMPADSGAQLLCTNTLPADFAVEFPFFACKYAVAVKRRLLPVALPVPNGNGVLEVVIGHPDPKRLAQQIGRLGVQEGVKLSVQTHPEKEVVTVVMKNGPIDLGDWRASFRFA